MLGSENSGERRENELGISSVTTTTTVVIEKKGLIEEEKEGNENNEGTNVISSGNRWPQEETLALLTIRSDMDVVFRDSGSKAPLWDQVSRKMAALGYDRSAKKCKEKFENIYKYHKRLKSCSYARSNGKAYRFFDQLEALDHHQISFPTSVSEQVDTAMKGTALAVEPISSNPQYVSHIAMPLSVNFDSSPITTSTSTTSSSGSESEGVRKKKRKWADFFDRLTKSVLDKQEDLQKKFLEAIDKCEHERLAREEAWKMQEMARIKREHELLMQERSISAAKDAAVLAFLQKISEQGSCLGTSGQLAENPVQEMRQKSFNNIKITILCGFVTILVLRGTIGFGDLTSSSAEAENQALIEETNRILAEIRSDKDPSDPDGQDDPPYNPNVTYTLGPRISNWDHERRNWLKQNPAFPNSVNGKGRILLVTGSTPNPCDNPLGDHYLLKGVKNKIDYCRLHGIEIVYNMAHLDREMAGYWAKLPLLRKLMLSHPEIEWIWWMDSDALFTDMVFEIPLEKYKDYNLVIHGYPDLLFEQKSWIALNTGSFLLRNCQWTLDLLDAWAPMGPKGPVRDEAGKVLTMNLKGRPAFEADDQSALIYLLISEKNKWMGKVYVENSYYLHGFWLGLVDKYEEMVEKNHPGLGDERWPFVTHFVGCKPCGSYGDYPVEKCLKSMERAFNFADNQVLKLYGFRHRGLLSPKVRRFRNETNDPLKIVNEFDIRRHVVVGSSKNN